MGLTGTVTVGLRDYETILSDLPLESIYAKPGGGVPQSAVYTLPSYWSVASWRGIPWRSCPEPGKATFSSPTWDVPPRSRSRPKRRYVSIST